MDKTKKEDVSDTSAAQDAKRKPIHTIRVEDCSASIWEREALVKGTPTVFRSATFERSYKDRDGTWKYTRGFDIPESIGRMMEVLRQLDDWNRGQMKG